MKRWTIPCEFGAVKSPFHVYIGAPSRNRHPLQNQADWLSRERGGMIPSAVMESFEKLHNIAVTYNNSFEDLCAVTMAVQDSSAGQSASQDAVKKNAEDKLKETGIRPYVSGHPWPPYAKDRNAAGDDILQHTQEETAVRAMEIAKVIWPGADDSARNARNLFLGLTLYLCAAPPNKKVTLSDIFGSITSDDAAYSMSVMLDTFGGCISPLCYTLITHWLSRNRELRNQMVALMTTNMIEFATAASQKTDGFDDLRLGLRKTLFPG